MPPFVFCIQDCYYIRAAYQNPRPHRHFAAHVLIGLDGPFITEIDGKHMQATGIAIASNVVHTVRTDADLLVIFIDELTPMARFVKYVLLQGMSCRSLGKETAAAVRGICQNVRTDEEAVKELTELVKFLAKWLYHHILGSDIMIGKMISEKPAGAGDNQKKSMFEFTDEYKTDIDFVDDEHKKLFEIIERTYDVINNPFLADKYDSIVSIIAELKDYTELHFKDEENYMEKIGYEGLAAQKLAHESFVERLAEINMEEVDDSQHEYLCELIDFLLGWLKNHILKMDKKIPVK